MSIQTILAFATMSQDEYDDFEERAAIIEYEAKKDRGYAETLALKEVMDKKRILNKSTEL